VGVGKIYESYRSGCYAPYAGEAFEDDDEVAVIHGPAELSFPALSDAMVDLRETLAAAAREGIIDEPLRDGLVAAFKRRFYRERSFDALSEVLSELAVPASSAETLMDWLPRGRISQKRADATALLEALASTEPELPAEREPFTFERTSLWAQFVEQSADGAAAIGAAEAQVLEELRLNDDLYDDVCRTAVLWTRLATGQGPAPADDAARRAALDRLRRRHGLLSRAALEAWAADCDLDRAGLDRLLDYEVAADSDGQAGESLDGALLDVLRSSGRYADLAARARDKAALLEEAESSASAPSALSSEALLDWYFEEKLERIVPPDVAHYALARGFGSLADFLTAIAREKVYLALKSAVGNEGRP